MRHVLKSGVAVLAMGAILVGAEATGRAETAAERGDAAACEAILAATAALTTVERFHFRLIARTPGRRRPAEHERFVLGDVVYTNSPAAGRWIKLPMTAEDRRALSAGLVTYPPQGCRDDGATTQAGAAARVFGYRQMLPAGAVAEGRLWVTAEGGLPLRYEGQAGETQIVMTFDYGAIVPPIGP